MNNFWILAQGGANESGEPAKITSRQPAEESITVEPGQNGTGPETVQQEPRPGAGHMQLIFIGLMFVLLYFVLFRGPRKKQQQQKRMIQSLKKNDRVRTIGGIIGTVIDVKDDEITLKVDESSNTKIKIVPGAISKNLLQD